MTEPELRRHSVLNSVKTPLGFFAVLLLFVEAILATAAVTNRANTSIVLGAMAVLFLATIVLFVLLAYFRPISSLYSPDDFLDEKRNMAELWEKQDELLNQANELKEAQVRLINEISKNRSLSDEHRLEIIKTIVDVLQEKRIPELDEEVLRPIVDRNSGKSSAT